MPNFLLSHFLIWMRDTKKAISKKGAKFKLILILIYFSKHQQLHQCPFDAQQTNIITKFGFFVTFILYGSNKEYYTNSKRDEMHLFFARKTFCSTCLSAAFLSAPVHQKLPKSAIPQANFCFLGS